MYGRGSVRDLRVSVERAPGTRPCLGLRIGGVLGMAVAFGVGGALLLRAPSGVKAHPVAGIGQKPRAHSSAAAVGSPKLRTSARTPSAPALATAAGSRRSVSGSVRARAGHAISGATVCTLRAAAPRREPDECTSTDTAGRFRVEIGVGATDVAASAAGYLPVRRVVPVSGAGANALDLVLSEGGADISGTVIDASGGTIAGSVVSTRSAPAADEPSEAWVLTDESGTFRLGAGPGWNEVTASAVAYSSTQLLLNAPYVGAQFVLAPAAGISGRVVVEGSDEPAPSVTVSAWRSEPESEAAVTALSDGAGRFRFERLSGGRYRLEAFSSELRALERWVSVGVGQESSDVVLTARPASSIEGDLTLSAGECESAYL